MKPIDVSKLETTVKRLESKMLYLQHSHYEDKNEVASPQKLDKIALSSNNATEFIELSEIEYLSAEGSYTCIHQKDKSEKMSSKLLGHYQAVLDPEKFCRIHRKYMVNVTHINRIDKGRTLTLVLSSGTSVQVSPAYREQLLRTLKKRISF